MLQICRKVSQSLHFKGKHAFFNICLIIYIFMGKCFAPTLADMRLQSLVMGFTSMIRRALLCSGAKHFPLRKKIKNQRFSRRVYFRGLYGYTRLKYIQKFENMLRQPLVCILYSNIFHSFKFTYFCMIFNFKSNN